MVKNEIFKMQLEHLKEALRMYRRARQVNRRGFKRYKGDAKTICKNVIKDCWNGTYFQTSCGHFNGFYIRDFATAVPGLLRLGYKKEVYKTLHYILTIYSRNWTLATTITVDKKPLHVFFYSPDSLPLLLYSLRLGASDLVQVFRPFFEEQIDYYFEHVLDDETGLVQVGKFSSMKDNVKRESSTYDNCMLAMLSNELDKTNLKNPFRGFKTNENIIDELWNGKYFYDDMKKEKYVAGDANTFPFWTGVINDKEKWQSCLKSIQKTKLDKPFPLKYSHETHRILFPLNLVLPDYEKDTIWIHLGLFFLEVVKKYDQKLFEKYIAMYTKNIEKHGTFLELYNPNGSVYKHWHYVSDEGMIWAAKYLELID